MEEQNKVFVHETTGALVVFPDFQAANPVLPRHLLAVKSILHAEGIADPARFTTELQKAS